MKPLLCLLSLLGFGFCSWADDFTNFRVPTHKVSSSSISLNAGFNRIADDASPNGTESEQMMHNGSASINYNWRRESDRISLSTSLYGSASEDLQRRESTYENYDYDGNYQYSNMLSRAYNLSNYVNGSLSESIYPWQTLIGINGSISGSVRYLQQGENRDDFVKSVFFWGQEESQRAETENEEWAQDYNFSAKIGPVFGKVRNVSPVAQTLVTEQRLIEEGVLSGPLTAQNRQALADLFYRQPTYSTLHSRAARFFWRDVEEVIKGDPAYVAPLSAYVTYRIAETYFGSTSRRIGYSIRPSVSYQHENRIIHRWWQQTVTRYGQEGYESEFYDRSHSNHDALRWGIQLNYHVPFGLDWQFDAWTGATHQPKNWYQSNEDLSYWEGYLQFNLHWLVADRWYADAASNTRCYFIDEVGDDTEHRNNYQTSLGFEVGYYIEDNISIAAGISDNFSWSEQRAYLYEDEIIAKNDQRSTNFSVGMSYAFSGELFPIHWYPY